MQGKKIFNDPVYGFVSVPYGILFDIIEHPYFQRLRRIKQLGLTDIVYPGAIHTRYSHALGALHLMGQAISVLRSKGVAISAEEEEAVQIAILLHDIGHGPISHALEQIIVPLHHEKISLAFMQELNVEFDGKLSTAIQIFTNDHPKRFLYQLVSGQLDMDRMDYLNRDSFFTGVSEGVIGYHRIIKMLNVVNGELVVEEKGLYSIEKFLVARRLMYWQAYLHKTVLAAEQMLIRAVQRAKELLIAGEDVPASPLLAKFLKKPVLDEKNNWLKEYAQLDDYDIFYSLKLWKTHPDLVLRVLSLGIIDRRLFRIEMQAKSFSEQYLASLQEETRENAGISMAETGYLVFEGVESNSAYTSNKEEIQILMKSGVIEAFSEVADHSFDAKIISRYYLCYPKNMPYICAQKNQ